MTSRDLRHLLLALTAVGLACVAPIAVGAPTDLLLAAPLLLVALPLLAGRYVGEDAIERLARFVTAGRRVRAGVPGAAATGRPASALPRGGALLAFALAVRPPPVAARVR